MHTFRFPIERLMAASTVAGVGLLLNMLGTYLVKICRGGLPLAAHCCWKSPRMPVYKPYRGTRVSRGVGVPHWGEALPWGSQQSCLLSCCVCGWPVEVAPSLPSGAATPPTQGTSNLEM